MRIAGRFIKETYLLIIFTILLISSCRHSDKSSIDFKTNEMIIRISEIDIHPDYLDEYIAILKEESEASVRLEPGVISIFPMFQRDNPAEIRILEIYSDKEAYESHLQTPHFKHYKTTTLEMVKSLNLIDMEVIDKETIPEIFRKSARAAQTER